MDSRLEEAGQDEAWQEEARQEAVQEEAAGGRAGGWVGRRPAGWILSPVDNTGGRQQCPSILPLHSKQFLSEIVAITPILLLQLCWDVALGTGHQLWPSSFPRLDKPAIRCSHTSLSF